MAGATGTTAPSAWAPLRVQAFRALWIAQLFSLIGTWMQTVGAQWLLVDEPNAATLVGLVQTAAMLPTLVLALPAGALADIVDRRRLLASVQLFQVAVGAGLTVLAFTDNLPPAVLLTATFLLGVGTTLTIPGYQTLVQELVGRDQTRSAAALNGVAMNLARAVGTGDRGRAHRAAGRRAGVRPERADLRRHGGRAGAPATADVARSSCSRSGSGAPWWPGPATSATRLPSGGSCCARCCSWCRAPRCGRCCRWWRAACSASTPPVTACCWAHWGSERSPVRRCSRGWWRCCRRRAWSSPRAWCSAWRAPACALAPNLLVAVVVLVPAGVAWLCMLATMNGNLQVFLPGWVRARGLSIYMMVFAGGQALASLAWGVVAEWFGLVPALVAAGALLVLGGVTVVAWPLRDVSGLDRNPAVYWPEPHLELDPELEDGPVLVTLTYTVPPENVSRFLDAMVPVRRMKMRTGATSFAVYRDGADPYRFVEVAQYPSWAEHLRQHGGRLTGSDRDLEAAATAYASEPPVVEHLLPTGTVAVDEDPDPTDT